MPRHLSAQACQDMRNMPNLSPPLIPDSDNQPAHAPAYAPCQSTTPPRAAPAVGRHHRSFRWYS
ncbi:hypothetical protein BPORC_1765 [Bifidobacterium porcinum]|nr:hypothetical protein BPORC_1765 [Bifidobacterium porcinum]